MHPDGDVSLAEVLESSGVVQVQMTDDDAFDVFDIVARLSDGSLQFMIGLISGPGEDVIERSSPYL